MDFSEYQLRSGLTDQQPNRKKKDAGLLIPLLGLAGETGSLLSEYKKKIRDGQIYEGFDDKASEEIGDILWYLSNVASRLGLSLDAIARQNLLKTEERWPIEQQKGKRPMLDSEYPESEQLPRKAKIRIYEDKNTGAAHMELLGDQCIILGDKLTDNAYEDDGYRFHDVMHLAHWAVLGWSPVIRRMLGRKRKSNPLIDEVEDGARAAIIEELIIAFIYSNAREHSFYEGARHLDSDMLSTITKICGHLEVKIRLSSQWERAILQGYRAFRAVKDSKDVVVQIDVNQGALRVQK